MQAGPLVYSLTVRWWSEAEQWWRCQLTSVRNPSQWSLADGAWPQSNSQKQLPRGYLRGQRQKYQGFGSLLSVSMSLSSYLVSVPKLWHNENINQTIFLTSLQVFAVNSQHYPYILHSIFTWEASDENCELVCCIHLWFGRQMRLLCSLVGNTTLTLRGIFVTQHAALYVLGNIKGKQ